ncbi:hypothetical protein [Variovorax sp. KK3]|uniref:hypothetical protein n=1 Tax=Variovorax sp. KK3 TaxID=1855728 RepID=UPI00097C6123|nr:hypothetical protein [Variovorax sp. KK3]
MADPLQVVSSLDRLADHYTVFERDQLLTHGQLNSVADFWGGQVRLSRVALSGVGLVAGLHVSRADGNVRVSRGFGVSTDGDLIALAADTVYDSFRPYDATAPVYPPFYPDRAAGDGALGAMFSLHELVPVGESDVLKKPLSALPDGVLDDCAVLMLMESVVNDPDICSGTDCDNLGRDAMHRVRLLLIGRRDAQRLLDALPLRPTSVAAQALPAAAMERPVVGKDIVDTGTFAKGYRDSAQASLKELQAALPSLNANCPEVLSDVFGSDPTPGWLASLASHSTQIAGAAAGLQLWYAFVKDLVDQWNALREALLADDAVALPDVAAFPKHLLLGSLAAPRAFRTGLYPSPLDATARECSAHARFHAWKLDALIASFQVPDDAVVRVTPSLSDVHALEARAIPWYYALRKEAPIHAAWNFKLSSRRQEDQNLGYRSNAWSEARRVTKPLAYAISGHDFFRIEGHLGAAAEAVTTALRRQIADFNLPFQVQAVLVHTSRDRIRVRPPFRYTPLHSLHYLVRQDVAFRLDESEQFGQLHLTQMSDAVTAKLIPATTSSGAPVLTSARQAGEAVASTNKTAAPVLTKARYSAYKAAATEQGPAIKASYASSLSSVRESRATLSELSRADTVSPFDGLLNTNQPHWIDWLDDLILDQGNKADDKLLLSRFVQDHPGLDHVGGVWRGGTFVLVYDDQGRVVGDFALPYPAAEAETPEADDPPLTRPPYRPPLVTGIATIRPVRPIDLVVNDRILAERTVFQKDLDVQRASLEGLVKGAFVPSNAVVPKTRELLDLTGNAYLDMQANEMARRRESVEALKGVLVQPGLPDDERVRVTSDLDRAQLELAETVGSVAAQLVTAGVDMDSPAGRQLTQSMATSVSTIQSPAAKTQVDTRLATAQGRAAGNQATVFANLRTLGR